MMSMSVTDKIASLALFALYFLAQCEAGEYCGNFYRRWCEYGCCNDDADCCDEEVTRIGLILGLVFGLGGTVIVVIVIICICRRRRTSGFVYRQQGAAPATVIVAQNQGVVTSNMPPGVAPVGQQQYGGGVQPQYGAYPQPQQAMPQPYPYPQTTGYAQAPPPYDATMAKQQY